MKRGHSGLCGVLAVDKPEGISSHDVVNCIVIRRITGERRVGHAGTLDPAATGLMLVGVGAATRLSAYLTGHDKTYIARIVFGAETDTDDAQGRLVELHGPAACPEQLAAFEHVDPASVLADLVGESMQLPPAYSAIKKNGVTAYKAAREGSALELEPRTIVVYDATLLGTGTEEVNLDDGAGGRFTATLPYWDVTLHVSKGTYIRAIARDLGVSLGCGAHLHALRRTAVAGFDVSRACTIEELERRVAAGQDLPWCNPASLLGFPVVELAEKQLSDVVNGRELVGVSTPSSPVSCVAGGRLLAVYANEGSVLKPATVFPEGVVGVA